MLHGHFHRESPADFAVIHFERPHFRFALRNGDVARTVVPHQHHIVREIHGVIFRERAAGAEGVHDLHGLGVFHFVFASDGNAARGQQGIAENDRADGVLIFRVAGAVVKIRERAKIVFLHQPVERDGSPRGAFQFGLRAIGLHSENLFEFRDALLDLLRVHFAAQRGEFIHLHDFQVTAKCGALQRRVGVNVQHPAIVMAHQTKTIVKHHMRHTRGFDPRIHFVPANRVVVQHPGDLVEINPGAVEDVGDFRHGTRGAKRQPVTGHRRAVAHFVEARVINGRCRREIQNDHWHFRALHHRQHGRGKRIRRDVKKDHVHVRLAEFVAGFQRLHRIVNQAEVDDLDAGTLQFFLDGADIAFEARLETFELRPISVKADAKKSDTQIHFIHRIISCSSNTEDGPDWRPKIWMISALQAYQY